MIADDLIDRLTIPGRVLRMTWRDDTQPTGPGWVVASWMDDPTPRREVIEVVASTLPVALERLAARLGVAL